MTGLTWDFENTFGAVWLTHWWIVTWEKGILEQVVFPTLFIKRQQQEIWKEDSATFGQHFLIIQRSVEDKQTVKLHLQTLKNIRILWEVGNKGIDVLELPQGKTLKSL